MTITAPRVAVLWQDDPTPFAGLRAALGAAGVSLATAVEQPDEALAAVRGGRPDLFVAAVHTEALRSALSRVEPALALCPTLVVAPDRRVAAGTLALTRGAAGYLCLPVDTDLLTQALAAVDAGLAVVGLGTTRPGGWRLGNPDPPELSAGEAAVLSLVAAGYRNRDIAEKLDVSVSTVKNRLLSAYARLRVHNRAAAAAEWLRTLSSSHQAPLGPGHRSPPI